MHSLLATSFRRHESQFPRASKHRHHTLEPSQQSAPTSHFSLYVYDMPTGRSPTTIPQCILERTPYRSNWKVICASWRQTGSRHDWFVQTKVYDCAHLKRPSSAVVSIRRLELPSVAAFSTVIFTQVTLYTGTAREGP
jgi:hypothetical protein